MAEVNTNGGNGRQKLSQVIKNHRSKLIIMCLLVIAGTGAWAFYLSRDQTSPPVNSTPAGRQVIILPEDQREMENVPLTADQNRKRDPFAGPLELKGIMRDAQGQDLVILEAGGIAHITGRGRTIADTWTIVDILPEAVILESDEETMKVEFGGIISVNPKSVLVFEEGDGDGE